LSKAASGFGGANVGAAGGGVIDRATQAVAVTMESMRKEERNQMLQSTALFWRRGWCNKTLLSFVGRLADLFVALVPQE
jgi:hypothetical protein